MNDQPRSPVKTLNALKARQNFGQMLEEVYYKGDQFIIERAGKPMAAVIPLWQLEEWQKHRERFFAAVQAVHQRNQKVKPTIIERDVEERVPDLNAPLILYCGGGYRSALAADNLQKMGYKNVFSMDGGIRGWREKGFPLTKD